MDKILVVDDDPHIREVVCVALEKAGFSTLTAGDGQDALRQHALHTPDLVVLDILMPELDGLSVCRELRNISPVPIVLLSSRDEEVDRIVGLEMGADDYVVKPFSPRELVARVRANLRRVQAPPLAADSNSQIVVGRLVVDGETHQVCYGGESIALTHTEFMLIKTLARRPSKVFSREDLMQGAYDVRRIVSNRTIDSHIRRLRDKLHAVGAAGIQTVHGVGYRLQPDDA
jgi:two-component system OmpR family response regulator